MNDTGGHLEFVTVQPDTGDNREVSFTDRITQNFRNRDCRRELGSRH